MVFGGWVSSVVVFSQFVIANEPPKLNPFSYRVKVPSTEVSCEARAQAMTQVFAKTLGVQSAVGTCQARQERVHQSLSYSVDVVVVNYLSEYEKIPSRTVFGEPRFLQPPSQDQGLFSNYANCLDELDRQNPDFEVNTGLAILAAYCTASTDEYHPGYSLTFEAFGTAKTRLQSYSLDDSQAGYAVLVARASEALIAQGLKIVWADTRHLFYYAQAPVAISVNNLATFLVRSQCETQQSAAGLVFTQAGLTRVSTLCEAVGEPEYQRYSLVAFGVGYASVSDDFGVQSEKYDTFEECLLDQARLEGNSRSSGRTVFGSLCERATYSYTGYLVHLFTRF